MTMGGGMGIWEKRDRYGKSGMAIEKGGKALRKECEALTEGKGLCYGRVLRFLNAAQPEATTQ